MYWTSNTCIEYMCRTPTNQSEWKQLNRTKDQKMTNLEKTLYKRGYPEWPINIWKGAQFISHSGKCKLKLQWHTTTHPPEWLKLKRWKMPKVGEDVE